MELSTALLKPSQELWGTIRAFSTSGTYTIEEEVDKDWTDAVALKYPDMHSLRMGLESLTVVQQIIKQHTVPLEIGMMGDGEPVIEIILLRVPVKIRNGNGVFVYQRKKVHVQWHEVLNIWS